MQNKGKLTIMKYFRACVGSFLVKYKYQASLTLQETRFIHNSMNLAKIEFISEMNHHS